MILYWVVGRLRRWHLPGELSILDGPGSNYLLNLTEDHYVKGVIVALVLVMGVTMTSFACVPPDDKITRSSFGEDLTFLKSHSDVIVLTARDGEGQVAVIASMQGRVMTSTLAGPDGLSLGWINKELIASGETLLHINPYGGEDRFWLGPEGGQFSIFFKEDAPFDLEHWYTPAPIDTEPFELVSRGQERVFLRKHVEVGNYSGTEFKLNVEREIRLLSESETFSTLGVSLGGSTKWVAYQSDNRIRNVGEEPWKKETGLLSIWILGMFNSSSSTTVVIPFRQLAEKPTEDIVNDDYFGEVPRERLVVEDGIIYFKGDAQYRSKIGVSPLHAKAILGSYDAEIKVLTLVRYTQPEGITDYVNSMWEIQDDPYKGDVVNSYNDGPPEPGAGQLGSFYELETSSPAAELEPGQSLSHVHGTFHFQASEKKLDEIARRTLGVGLERIKLAFR